MRERTGSAEDRMRIMTQLAITMVILVSPFCGCSLSKNRGVVDNEQQQKTIERIRIIKKLEKVPFETRQTVDSNKGGEHEIEYDNHFEKSSKHSKQGE